MTGQAKDIWKPGTMIYPAPPVLVSCGTPDHSNLLTVAWTGTICNDPAMCYISVRPERFSHTLIKDTMEFTINLTTAAMARGVDWCGVRSGRDYDKWEETGFTPMAGHSVQCPCVAESPLSIECRVTDMVSLGSHDMFIANVLCLRPDKDLIDTDTGVFRLDQAGLVSYSHGQYFAQGEPIGRFGFSVKKK